MRWWKAGTREMLQPLTGGAGSAGSHAAKMRPGGGPLLAICRPTGAVLHAEAASAMAPPTAPPGVRLARTSLGAPKVLPPSVETLTQLWLGPEESGSVDSTSAEAVV